MPRYNGTGPGGLGAGTGWGLGPCGGGMAYGRRGGGRGWGRGYGRGFGLGRFGGYDPYYPASVPSKKEETEILSEDAKNLEEELKAVKARLAELKGQK